MQDFPHDCGMVDTWDFAACYGDFAVCYGDFTVCYGDFTVCYVVLVRYSIYRSIAILVNVRYRYLVVSRYFDISNIE